MKKILVFLAAVLLFAFVGCNSDTPKEIVLSFDSQTAYFASETTLYPIAGETPAEQDSTETATIIISANEASKMRLEMTNTGDTTIEGLMVRVNEGTPIAFDQETVILYESASAETSATLLVEIYLAADTPASSANKTLTFSLQLSYEEAE